MFEEGRGRLGRDARQAAELYLRAAAQGNAYAREGLRRLGTGVGGAGVSVFSAAGPRLCGPR